MATARRGVNASAVNALKGSQADARLSFALGVGATTGSYLLDDLAFDAN